MSKPAYNDFVREAIEMASIAHKGQCRKGTKIPYIVHPFEVAMILKENSIEDEEIIVAGILHDTLEDTNVKSKDIEEKFTKRVLCLILAASEELKDRNRTPWLKRKEHTVEQLKEAELSVKLIACADKLSNARSMIKDYEQIGDGMWEKFNAGYELQKWYYNALVESLEDLREYSMYQELKKIVSKLF